MTRRELYDVLRLKAGKVYPRREADAVAMTALEDLYGISPAALLSDPAAAVSISGGLPPEEAARRLESAEPVQYITGRTMFCGMSFRVGRGVLIPRPETEELVRWMVCDLKGTDRPCIMDLGTGSGAIAVSLAAALPGARITATDISGEALSISTSNACDNGVGVRFVRADMLAGPAGFEELPEKGAADAVVSNPPYVPFSERAAMHANVSRWEPETALFVPDDDPLLFYRAVERWGAYFLKPGGGVWLEAHENCAAAVAEFFGKEGWKEVTVRKDMNSKPRMIKCTRP